MRLYSSCMSLGFIWCIYKCTIGFRGPIAATLGLGPVRYLGKISYGIYVWHLPVLFFIPALISSSGAAFLAPYQNDLLLRAAFTVAIASLTWYSFERPCLNLKPVLARRYLMWRTTGKLHNRAPCSPGQDPAPHSH